MTDPISQPLVNVVFFTKDRPLQLHAAATSLWATCADPEVLRVRALTFASTEAMAARYLEVARELPRLEFVPEAGFQDTLVRISDGVPYLLFVVDDALFVQPWSATAAVEGLRQVPEALGVSLRLGRNTTTSYAMSRPQKVPPFVRAGPWLAYEWGTAQLDFGYPLELSSSLYRTSDLGPLLGSLRYRNPNELEAALAASAGQFRGSHPVLLMAETSRAFCAPLNVVQTTFPNRAGSRPEYGVENLGALLDAGCRVDVGALRGYVPGACHEEIALPLLRAAAPRAAAAEAALPRAGEVAPRARGTRGASARFSLPSAPADPFDSLRVLVASGVWREGTPLRLQLGCGQKPMPGYVNVDLAPGKDSFKPTTADVFGNVPALRFPPGTVDEIRSHHMFEHFPRVEALALLIRWQEWLRLGGKLVIETPDLEGSARTLLSDQPYEVKMGVIRHLAGDQAERWAFHVDHWLPARFHRTLGDLGFGAIEVEQRSWSRPPFLSDVVAMGTKTTALPREELLTRADGLLAHATVAEEERPLLERWRRQLRLALEGEPLFEERARGGPQAA